jgi:hypothetical protein
MLLLKLFGVLVICLTGIGCAHTKHSSPKIESKPQGMMDIYAQAIGQSQHDVAKYVQENLKEQKTFGYVKPYIPVVNQPVVRKVWIPDHKSDDNNDVLIAGHWVYLMIQPASWFIDNKQPHSQIPIIVPLGPRDQSKSPQNGAKAENVTDNFPS